MKSKKYFDEIKTKDTAILNKELVNLRAKLCDLRFKAAFRNLKNFSEIKATRQNIARLETLLSDRAISTAIKSIEKTSEGKND